jgi:pyridoxine 5-phosphate synthase
MAYLSVKLDHVAALREQRKIKTPDPAHAAVLAEIGGADGIMVHLRRDRRHFRDRDLYILREVVRTRLTVEITPTEENLSRIAEVKPYMAIFVPETDGEITTQSGLNVEIEADRLAESARRLQESGIRVATHIEPSTEAVRRAGRMKVDAVKLHTGLYATAKREEDGMAELARIERAAQAAGKIDLVVMAGQGLDYDNIRPLARLGVIDEYVIGQAIVARAVLVGMERAVRDMRDAIAAKTPGPNR